MLTLGVYSGDSENAAVVVDAGTVVSAVHAAGQREHTTLPASSQQALAIAGVQLSDVDIVSVTDSRTAPLAQAAQLRVIVPDILSAIVIDDDARGTAWTVDLGASPEATEIGGAHLLLQTAGTVARALGLPGAEPITALESVAMADSCTPTPATVERQGSRYAVSIDTSAVDSLLQELAARCATPGDVAASQHVDVQRKRTQAATAMLEGLATAFATIAERTDRPTRSTVALAGTACTSAEFVARVRRRIDAVIAPVPERFGEALGAALLPQRDVHPLAHLALGASFSESEIKAVLENCRLDYVYEPDWSRMFTRVSDLLVTGALVGWYQGRADFSRHSFGTRSILCDPSRRYSRENVNVFLQHQPVQAPLPVSFEHSVASGCGGPTDAFSYIAEAPALVLAFGSAVDHGRLRCHVANPLAVPEFHGLLRTHRERTQVPGLLNVPMLAGAVLAPTPRDAVRETYASAADALVIGRFVVAKDYWLLRGQASH